MHSRKCRKKTEQKICFKKETYKKDTSEKGANIIDVPEGGVL